MLLWLSGPTGSGKSSLAALLAKLGISVVAEELPEGLFDEFTREPAKNCVALQEAIIRSRRRQWADCAGAERVLLDRSIEEDVAVFCRLHHERGLIDDNELTQLRSIADRLCSDMPRPDLIVYLNPGIQALRERLRQEGHPPVIVEGLERQVVLYEDWIAGRRESVLRVDNATCRREALNGLLGGSSSC